MKLGPRVDISGVAIGFGISESLETDSRATPRNTIWTVTMSSGTVRYDREASPQWTAVVDDRTNCRGYGRAAVGETGVTGRRKALKNASIEFITGLSRLCRTLTQYRAERKQREGQRLEAEAAPTAKRLKDARVTEEAGTRRSRLGSNCCWSSRENGSKAACYANSSTRQSEIIWLATVTFSEAANFMRGCLGRPPGRPSRPAYREPSFRTGYRSG